MIDLLKDGFAVIGGLVMTAGVWVRVEVGQALNRQSIKHMKEERDRDRDEMRDTLHELRSDIKTLLQRTAE